jgi:hypothetical protein
MEAAAAAAGKRAPEQVVVHPLVLLSVVDHYNRVAKDTKKRVVGVILGESYKGRIDATNAFAGAAACARLFTLTVMDVMCGRRYLEQLFSCIAHGPAIAGILPTY